IDSRLGKRQQSPGSSSRQGLRHGETLQRPGLVRACLTRSLRPLFRWRDVDARRALDEWRSRLGASEVESDAVRGQDRCRMRPSVANDREKDVARADQRFCCLIGFVAGELKYPPRFFSESLLVRTRV